MIYFKNPGLFILVSIVMSCCRNTPITLTETNPHILFENLQKSFDKKKKQKIYPPYYGGAYLNDSSLIIIAIGDSTKCRQQLAKRCKGTHFTLIYCKNQQEAIRRMLHYLYIFRTDEKYRNTAEDLQFIGSFPNPDGRITVQLLSFREEDFKQKVLDSPYIDFAQNILLFE